MKYLKKYMMFESNNVIDDFFDIIQIEIMDEYGISSEDVVYKRDNASMTLLYSDTNIVDSIYLIQDRIREATGKFAIPKIYKEKIEISLSDFPDNRIVIEKFELKKCKTDNGYDRSIGGYCDLNKALEIISYLNGFYRFIYDSDINKLKESYFILSKRYNVNLKFSLPIFKDERFRQLLCFEFELSDGLEKVVDKYFPVFIVNTNYTESPYIWLRKSNHSSLIMPFDSAAKKCLSYF